MPNSTTPAGQASVSPKAIYCAEAGPAMAPSAENMTLVPATAGPETSCHEEPESAATNAGITPA